MRRSSRPSVLAAPAHAGDDQIVITGDVEVPRGQTVGDIVVIDGSVRIGPRDRRRRRGQRAGADQRAGRRRRRRDRRTRLRRPGRPGRRRRLVRRQGPGDHGPGAVGGKTREARLRRVHLTARACSRPGSPCGWRCPSRPCCSASRCCGSPPAPWRRRSRWPDRYRGRDRHRARRVLRVACGGRDADDHGARPATGDRAAARAAADLRDRLHDQRVPARPRDREAAHEPLPRLPGRLGDPARDRADPGTRHPRLVRRHGVRARSPRDRPVALPARAGHRLPGRRRSRLERGRVPGRSSSSGTTGRSMLRNLEPDEARRPPHVRVDGALRESWRGRWRRATRSRSLPGRSSTRSWTPTAALRDAPGRGGGRASAPMPAERKGAYSRPARSTATRPSTCPSGSSSTGWWASSASSSTTTAARTSTARCSAPYVERGDRGMHDWPTPSWAREAAAGLTRLRALRRAPTARTRAGSRSWMSTSSCSRHGRAAARGAVASTRSYPGVVVNRADVRDLRARDEAGRAW